MPIANPMDLALDVHSMIYTAVDSRSNKVTIRENTTKHFDGWILRAPAPRQAQRSAGVLDAPAPAPRGAATLAVRVGGADASDMHQRSVGQCNEIAFCDVCVWSPSGDMLVDKLSLVLRQGERLLISGPNGCGKRTLISLHHLLETFLYLYF